MILDIACTPAALYERSSICRERRSVPWCVTHTHTGDTGEAALAVAGEDLARMEEHETFGTDEEYPTFDEDELDDQEDTKEDVDKDNGGAGERVC